MASFTDSGSLSVFILTQSLGHYHSMHWASQYHPWTVNRLHYTGSTAVLDLGHIVQLQVVKGDPKQRGKLAWNRKCAKTSICWNNLMLNSPEANKWREKNAHFLWFQANLPLCLGSHLTACNIQPRCSTKSTLAVMLSYSFNDVSRKWLVHHIIIIT